MTVVKHRQIDKSYEIYLALYHEDKNKMSARNFIRNKIVSRIIATLKQVNQP